MVFTSHTLVQPPLWLVVGVWRKSTGLGANRGEILVRMKFQLKTIPKKRKITANVNSDSLPPKKPNYRGTKRKLGAPRCLTSAVIPYSHTNWRIPSFTQPS